MTTSFLQSLVDGAGLAQLTTDTKAALIVVAFFPIAWASFRLYKKLMARGV